MYFDIRKIVFSTAKQRSNPILNQTSIYIFNQTQSVNKRKESQLREESTSISEFLLILLEASPLTQFLLVAFIIAQVAH